MGVLKFLLNSSGEEVTVEFAGQSNMEWTLAGSHGEDHRYAATQASHAFIDDTR